MIDGEDSANSITILTNQDKLILLWVPERTGPTAVRLMEFRDLALPSLVNPPDTCSAPRDTWLWGAPLVSWPSEQTRYLANGSSRIHVS
ncbi:hypothetical protein BHM03_00014621 [Ensete ventricosum]|nr:hypothetical protein BHM03_00014621 [Ensete ventricosum]